MAVPENNSGLLIVADRNRKKEYLARIGEASLVDSVIAVDDVVRVKIGRGNKTPLLEFSSGTPGSAGSTCTAANPTAIAFEAGDLTFPAGLYDVEITVVDKSDANAPKKAERGVFHLRESCGGSVALS